MSFTHAQASVVGLADTSGNTSFTLTLASTPAVGDLILVGAQTYDTPTAPTITSVVDGNSNAYTHTPSSPLVGSPGYTYIFSLVAPSNVSKVITVHLSTALTSSGIACGFADDFTPSGNGVVLFDQDAKASTASGTSPTTGPTITPANPSSLLYAYGNPSTHFTGVGGSWVADTVGEGENGDWSEWILSDSSAQTANFTFTGTISWGVVMASFFVGLVADDDSYNPNKQILFEPTISVWG